MVVPNLGRFLRPHQLEEAHHRARIRRSHLRDRDERLGLVDEQIPKATARHPLVLHRSRRLHGRDLRSREGLGLPPLERYPQSIRLAPINQERVAFAELEGDPSFVEASLRSLGMDETLKIRMLNERRERDAYALPSLVYPIAGNRIV